ncbi:tyrosine-type recombinase/integrase [Spirochaeta cellobiosiphila]|uniref:tyrosine-type recombinase/integrase n=1 Tax=Spirochaeta cellobiosiphila TaxID=504483 RepID=UPI0004180BD4|nr:site-specific integrase [Spirochaeta cellobiosiphila]
MPRQQQPYALRKRGDYWHYKLKDSHFKTTGKKNKAQAMTYALNKFNESQKIANHKQTIKNWINLFYIPETCPHVQRLRAEGKRISERHCNTERSRIERLILTDKKICNMVMSETRRGDILDFRERLIKKHGRTSKVNKAIGTLKTAFKEAYFREIIDRDPTQGIGNIKYEVQQVGIFTRSELKKLFHTEYPGIWVDKMTYLIFYMAASAGLRRGEIFALKWSDLNGNVLTINRAWADAKGTILDLPKWGKKRETIITHDLANKLAEYRETQFARQDDDFIFSYSDGQRVSFTLWKRRFATALKRAAEMEDDDSPDFKNIENRNLKPHSFRHTLNTLLLAEGMSDILIQASFGWSNPVTQQGYTHLGVEHIREQKNIVEGIFG